MYSVGVYRVSIFRLRLEPDLPDLCMESGWILPDDPATTGFFSNKIFIIHPRKYEARRTKRKLPSIYVTVLSSDGNHMYFRSVGSNFAPLIIKLTE